MIFRADRSGFLPGKSLGMGACTSRDASFSSAVDSARNRGTGAAAARIGLLLLPLLSSTGLSEGDPIEGRHNGGSEVTELGAVLAE